MGQILPSHNKYKKQLKTIEVSIRDVRIKTYTNKNQRSVIIAEVWGCIIFAHIELVFCTKHSN